MLKNIYTYMHITIILSLYLNKIQCGYIEFGIKNNKKKQISVLQQLTRNIILLAIV